MFLYEEHVCDFTLFSKFVFTHKHGKHVYMENIVHIYM